MKKFSDLVKENESKKVFKYTVKVDIEGTVMASSEAEAGELIDKEMDTIPGMVNYEIGNISQEASEGYINPDLAIKE